MVRPMLPERIATARLVLTPLETADAEAMTDVLADPSLYEFTGGRPPSTDELGQRYRRQTAGRSADGTQLWLNWIVRLEGRPIGTVQATVGEKGAQGEMAWVVAPAWQRRGYAVEATAAAVAWLRTRGVIRFRAHVHPDHVASAAVASAVGFTRTDELHDGEQRWVIPTGTEG